MTDFRGVMDNEEETPYVDSIHYTDTGTDLLADALLDILEQDIQRARSTYNP